MNRRHWLGSALLTGGILATSPPAAKSGSAQSEKPGISELANVTFQPIFTSPDLDNVPVRATISVQRLIFAPGGVLDVRFPGPVVYFVESGELWFTFRDDGTMAFTDTNPPSGQERRQRRAGSGEPEPTLQAGQTVSVSDGNLGRVTNQGPAEASVLAVILTPSDGPGFQTETLPDVEAELEPTRTS